MTDEAGPGGYELSPTDAAILEMIREGRYDAEIASRLYISTADVKARIERMLTRGGLRERSDFIRPPVPELEDREVETPPFERPPRTISLHNAVLSALGALAIGVGVGWVLRDEQAGSSAVEDTDSTAYLSFGPDSVRSDQIVGVRVPSLTLADALWLLGTPATGSSTSVVRRGVTPTPSVIVLGTLFRREIGAYAVNAYGPDGEGGKDVVFVDTTLIDLSAGNWTIDRLSNGQLTLTARLPDNTLVLRLEPLNAVTLIERSDDGIRVSSTDGSTPKVNMKLDGAQWSLGLDGRLVVYL